MKMSAIGLTGEAHRILGHKIELYTHLGSTINDFTNWRFTFGDGSEWCRAYCDDVELSNKVLESLNADNYAESDTLELFEHDSWPRDWKVVISKGQVRGIPPVFCILDFDGDILITESILGLAITRGFVLAHHLRLEL